MNKSIATFEKVSFDEYFSARKKMFGDVTKEVKAALFEEWKNIKLPQRSTSGAAGYDFYIPFETFVSDNSVLIPTGIRVQIEEGWVLMLFPRSGLGTKYGFALDNTVGIIDSDYYHADNEGHIMAKVRVDDLITLEAGDRFMQGVFLPFGIASNGNSENTRTGGFGSTGNK